MCPLKSQIQIRINLVGNCSEIVYTRSYTAMPTLPTSGEKLECLYSPFTSLPDFYQSSSFEHISLIIFWSFNRWDFFNEKQIESVCCEIWEAKLLQKVKSS